MSKKNKGVSLELLRERLQARMHYEDPEEAFDALLFGFSRFKKYSSGWKSDVKAAGCMSTKLARDFAIYVGYPIA